MAGKAAKPAPASDAPEGEGEAGGKKKMAGKTLVLFVVLPALLVLGAGGAAAFFLMGPKKDPAAVEQAEGEDAKADDHAKADDGHGKDAKKKDDGHGKKDAKADAHGAKGEGEAVDGPQISEGDGVYFVHLPELLVNVTGSDRPGLLKLKLAIETPDHGTAESIGPTMPRLTDQFQSFLRELRLEDLNGSAGAYRLRLELLRRVNIAIAPAEANAVLIEEMLVQ